MRPSTTSVAKEKELMRLTGQNLLKLDENTLQKMIDDKELEETFICHQRDMFDFESTLSRSSHVTESDIFNFKSNSKYGKKNYAISSYNRLQ